MLRRSILELEEEAEGVRRRTGPLLRLDSVVISA